MSQSHDLSWICMSATLLTHPILKPHCALGCCTFEVGGDARVCPPNSPPILPDTVVHMMQNCIFIPLSFLTTAALDHIQLIKNVKFWCITFGNGTGHTSIDENTFPTEDSLSESDFWQAYKNWLALVKLLSGPAVVDGWHSHHGKMISDHHFSLWFPAW